VIAGGNGNVSTDFSKSGGGPLVLIFYQISFPITVFSSPPESGENTLARKLGKKEYMFFSISVARALLKSGHNFLNKFVSTEQNIVSVILSIKSSGIFFVVCGVLWFDLSGFFYFIKKHLVMDHKA